MKQKPRLANSVLARADAYREGLLFGAAPAGVEVHPLETVQPPAAQPVGVPAGVDPEVTAGQAQGKPALGTLLDQSGRGEVE